MPAAFDPPNAVISFVETGDETPEDAIVVLKDPQIEGDSLTYTGRHPEPVRTAARALTLVTYGPVAHLQADGRPLGEALPDARRVSGVVVPVAVV